MNKIGILGGTFDPIHNGHLYMAEQAYKQLGLDEVIFIPTGKVPHKDNEFISDSRHRYNMVCLATNNFENYSVSDMEITRDRTCYTYETVKELAEKYKDSKIYFIIGADSAYDLNKWKKPYEILKYCSLAVVNRVTDKHKDLLDYCKQKEEEFKGEIVVLDGFGPEISSTEIRTNIKTKRGADNMLPREVLKYIIENKLYMES